LYLQVQVVENAAFEVLLGRPFFALGQAQSEDSMEGEQKLALTDPNNHSKVTVVTLPRPQRPPASREPQTGF
ncbi:hypothetical protein JAAARDRAFT_132602, partial [Jaapia argillacea MUCL 33604]